MAIQQPDNSILLVTDSYSADEFKMLYETIIGVRGNNAVISISPDAHHKAFKDRRTIVDVTDIYDDVVTTTRYRMTTDNFIAMMKGD